MLQPVASLRLYAIAEQASLTLCVANEVRCLPITGPSMLKHASADFEAAYLTDVLRLQAGVTEAQWDEDLRGEAREFGVEVNVQAEDQHKSHNAKPLAADTARRSQESVASRTSQSTGLISNFSDVSRDQHIHPHGRIQGRASSSIQDYDIFLARGSVHGRQSLSYSPPSTPSQSTFSLLLSSPESPPKKHFRRIRGLSVLRLHRTESNISLNGSCPHCPQGPLSQRRAVHKLPCGHRLCTQALRSTIAVGTDGKTGARPSCCGIPIPGRLVDHVMSQAEHGAVLKKFEVSDEPVSRSQSTTSEGQVPEPARRPGALSPSSRTVSDESKVDSVAPDVQKDLERLMESPEYKQMRKEQGDMRDRFLVWIEKQRSALEAQHRKLKEDMVARHEACTEELLERHNAATSEAEDKQVSAEADMRKVHLQEKRDNATALKHMEAYCAGTYSTGESHKRSITEQDRAELDKTRRSRDQMDARHENAINVLRGEQSRRMRLRAHRQERVVQDLCRAQRKEEMDLERACSEAVRSVDEMVAEKRQRMRSRWQLQTAVFVKNLERHTGTIIRGRLPSVEWQQGTLDDLSAAPSAAESLALGK